MILSERAGAVLALTGYLVPPFNMHGRLEQGTSGCGFPTGQPVLIGGQSILFPPLDKTS